MKNIGLFILVVLVWGAKSQADKPEFICQNKVLVEYRESQNWSKLEELLPAHSNFIAEQLKSGTMEVAGPVLSHSGEPVGGLLLYRGADLKKIESLVKQDPFIVQDVMSFSMRAWLQCVLQEGK